MLVSKLLYRLVGLLTLIVTSTVVDVSAQSCTITPRNPTTLTDTGGALVSGTTDVRIRCVCTTTIARWYDPGVVIINRDVHETYVAGSPYVIRANNKRDITLVIPTFNDSYNGTYYCGIRDTDTSFNDPSAAVTLTIVPSPTVTISPSGPIQGAMVGSPQNIQCTVSTVSEVESSSVMISWMGPGGNIDATNGRVSVGSFTDDGNNMYTRSLQFTYLMEGDEDNYTCNVMMLGTDVSQSVDLQSLNIPNPSVTVTAPNTQTVGQSLALQCKVTTVRGITSSVDIVWSSGERMDDVSSTTMGNSLVYTDSYTISQLSTTDDGRVIQCEVVINTSPSVMATDSITLDVTVPNPSITISPSGPIQGAMVGSSQNIQCTVSTVSGVESSLVMISWRGPGGNIDATNGRVSIGSVTDDGNNVYTRSLQFTYLMEGDEGNYTCNVMILETSASQSVELQSLNIPTPTVSVTAPNTQIVGQSLTLQCEVTTVRGITSRVDIVWRSSGGMELKRMNDVSSTTMDNSLVYTHSYTISQLSTSDRVIQCEVVINTSPSVMATESVTLDVNVPTPTITISPSGAIQGAMVGSSQNIQCTVSTVSGVEYSSVMISWMGPEGNIITNNSRVTISQTTSSGNYMYTRNLQFTYLMEGDEGTYTCNVSILDTNGANLIEIQDLSISTPTVSVTAPNTQTVGQSLILQCEVTTVRGITSRVDIVWSSGDMELKRMNDVSSTIMGNSLVYRDSCTISQLSTTDEGRVILCEAVINASPSVVANESITLDVTVPQATISVSQSSEEPVSGLNHTLTCIATVVNGVSPSLVMVNWDREDTTAMVSSDDGLQHTRITTFSPLLSRDRGLYTCSVSVNGFSEADNSDSVTIIVNDPTLSVTVDPPVIKGDTTEVAINLTCTATVEESITSDEYQFTWMHNEVPIDQSDGRINFNPTSDNVQSLFISSSDAMRRDSGVYTCQVNLAISETDNFNASNTATVLLTEESPPLAPNVKNLITTPYSVDISWIVTGIIFDNETYIVWYGTDNMTLQRSMAILGNTDLFTFNEVFSVNISELTPFTTYYYIISANNSIETTNTTVMTFMTNETAPSIAPQNFRSVSMTATSITFQWDSLTASEANGIVRNFTVTCTPDESPPITVSGTTGTVRGLSIFTEYNCTIFASTVSPGPVSDPPITVMTAESAPNPPVINTIVAINNSTVRVNWTRPTMPNGIITSYTIRYGTDISTESESVSYTGGETQSYNITGLSPYQLVRVTITATNGGGTSDFSDEVLGRSSEGVPGVVEIEATKEENVTWSPPSQPNGIITDYQVIYSIYENISDMMSELLDNDTYEYSIDGLTAGVPYEVVVVAFTSAGKGLENEYTVFFTKEFAPTKSPENVAFKQLNSTALNITWTPLTLFEARGFPEYRVVLTTVDTNSQRKRQSNSLEIITNNSFAIFTGLNENTVYSTIIGVTTGSSTEYVNSNSTNVNTTLPASDIEEESSSSSIIPIIGGVAAGVVAIIIVIVIIIVICCVVHRSRSQSTSMNIKQASTSLVRKLSFTRRESFSKKNEPQLIGSNSDADFLNNNHSTFEMDKITNGVKNTAVVSKPILLKDFAAHVAEMHKNDDHGFEVEFGSISSEPIAQAKEAKLPTNTVKNRYANIYGYDHSRVVLHCNSDTEADYINASYIDGFSKPKTYIATQGPMPGTVQDFWQMIWDQKIKTVVMLTKLMEGSKMKCEQYWPNNVGDSTNPKPSLVVTLVQQQMFAEYELRTLQVKSTIEADAVPLELNHFFFTGWPDHGVPKYATALLSFIKRVRQSHSKDGPPMVVHCSAGVGRTGTFIALDIMLERIPQTHDVNVLECVQNMRANRTFMVQTKAQYIFIHDALDDLITCGETAFNVLSLRLKTSRMSQVIPGTKTTGFEQQFELLQSVSRTVTPDDCSEALAEYNREKNFSLKAVPYNGKRVFLPPLKLLGSDYINASFIDGYKHRNAYIATQCPLVSTVDSFWRMLWEFKSAVVVTLCSPQHDKKDFLQYWPTKATEYGNIKVNLTSSGNSNGYDIYKFAVSQEQQNPRQVTMLHYTDWPADGIAKDEHVILNLIKEVLEIQRTTGNKAIIVMCSDGCARTGTFITISYALDRMKVDGIIDIFHAVKSSRINRAGLVANAVQYKYCHQVVSEFLDDFDQYSNFK